MSPERIITNSVVTHHDR